RRRRNSTPSSRRGRGELTANRESSEDPEKGWQRNCTIGANSERPSGAVALTPRKRGTNAKAVGSLRNGGARALGDTASATPITDACPRLNGGFSRGTAVDPTYQSNAANLGTANGGCNVLITFAANGSITTTHPNTQGFYDDGREHPLKFLREEQV